MKGRESKGWYEDVINYGIMTHHVQKAQDCKMEQDLSVNPQFAC